MCSKVIKGLRLNIENKNKLFTKNKKKTWNTKQMNVRIEA